MCCGVGCGVQTLDGPSTPQGPRASSACVHDKLYVGLHKRPQIKNLTLQLKEEKKKEQIKPQTSRSKEKIKIRAKISGLENRKKKERKENQ